MSGKVMRITVNGEMLSLTKALQPEHDKKYVNLYKFRPNSRNFTPKQLCETMPARIYTAEEIEQFEIDNKEMIDAMIAYWRQPKI